MEAFGTARILDLSIRLAVDRKSLTWPTAKELNDPDATLGGNHLYEDLRWAQWSHVRRLLAIETRAIEQIMRDADPRAAAVQLEETHQRIAELREHPLWGLDLGVASTTFALAAAGAIPVMSCNGGMFGGLHRGAHPYVACYARKKTVPQLLAWASQAGAGLISEEGHLLLYANRIGPMVSFAEIACPPSP